MGSWCICFPGKEPWLSSMNFVNIIDWELQGALPVRQQRMASTPITYTCLVSTISHWYLMNFQVPKLIFWLCFTTLCNLLWKLVTLCQPIKCNTKPIATWSFRFFAFFRPWLSPVLLVYSWSSQQVLVIDICGLIVRETTTVLVLRNTFNGFSILPCTQTQIFSQIFPSLRTILLLVWMWLVSSCRPGAWLSPLRVKRDIVCHCMSKTLTR